MRAASSDGHFSRPHTAMTKSRCRHGVHGDGVVPEAGVPRRRSVRPAPRNSGIIFGIIECRAGCDHWQRREIAGLHNRGRDPARRRLSDELFHVKPSDRRGAPRQRRLRQGRRPIVLHLSLRLPGRDDLCSRLLGSVENPVDVRPHDTLGSADLRLSGSRSRAISRRSKTQENGSDRTR